MNSYLKELILIAVGLAIGILLMKSCTKSPSPVIVTDTELKAKLDSITAIIGVVQIERSESIVREMNQQQKILQYERTIKALSARTYTDMQRDEWIESYRAKPE